jgi:cytochrome c551/c552
MPSLGANPDDWVSSVVNYIRYEFGNAGRRFRRPGDTTSPFVSIPEVAAIRNQYATRTALWTLEELETGNPTVEVAKPPVDSVVKKAAVKKTVAVKKINYAAVEPLLQKYTCLACHHTSNKLLGPSYREVANKKYSVAQIIQLIQKPNPANWPGYNTKMPPMAHVPAKELNQIALWIKSLETAK